MSYTKRQREAMRWVGMLSNMAKSLRGKNARSEGAEQIVASVRRQEKRKRAQFRRSP